MGMAVARQRGAGVVRSREFWDLFMALSSDAVLSAALAGAMEHAFDESVGAAHQSACHTGAGRSKLLLCRATPHGLGKATF